MTAPPFRATAAAVLIASTMSTPASEPFSLSLRERDGTTRSLKRAEWEPGKTAIIVCDFWDSHHSVTAVRRVNEMASRLNAVLAEARSRGATIIHAPSDCMPAYQDHPARERALAAPGAGGAPHDIGAWCHRIPSEEAAAYPIDQSDGGEDETAWEDAQWGAALKKQGRNPATPWLEQNPRLDIADTDFIAAEGDVVWNVLKSQGIEHVILTGVHTNMCVLGRPFGLRNMVRGGMDTVLMRDMTDVMYNPARWPYVSHFTGLDLVVGHIERFVCPTITSDQIAGGEPFRFKGDTRPRIEIIVKDTSDLDPAKRFGRRYLDPSFQVSYTDITMPAAEAFVPDARLDASVATIFPVDTSSPIPTVLLGRDIPEGRSLSEAGARRVSIKAMDFGDPDFDREVFESLCWVTDQPVPASPPGDPDARRASEGWHAAGTAPARSKHRDFRTLLRTPTDLAPRSRALHGTAQSVFLNGTRLASTEEAVWSIPGDLLMAGDLNLLVVRTKGGVAPEVTMVDGDHAAALSGARWQERSTDGAPDVRFPIPPQFGAPTDLIQNWPLLDPQ